MATDSLDLRDPLVSLKNNLGMLPTLLGYQLGTAKSIVIDSFSKTLSHKKLTPKLFGMLVVVESNSGVNQTVLSDLLNFDRGQTVRYLDRLQEQGLIRRTRDKKDRRNQIIEIENKGKTLVASLAKIVQIHETKITSNLSSRERATLMLLLRKLCSR